MPTPVPSIEFFWDPVCPFAWITSRWVHKVAAQKDYAVDWRFISLHFLNKDNEGRSPEHKKAHHAGLRMLRVAASIRAELGREKMGELYTAYGQSYFDQEESSGIRERLGSTSHIVDVLQSLGIDPDFVRAADDEAFDQEIEDETELALDRVGRNVGTPIITFDPPDGLSFFGPVISRIPDNKDALELWEATVTLARFPGFAELKRTLRETPQLKIYQRR